MKTIRIALSFVLVCFLINQASYAGSPIDEFLGKQRLSIGHGLRLQTDGLQPDFQTPPPLKKSFQPDVDLLHKIFGYGTILLAGIAAFTGSDDPDSIHHNASVGAAGLGALTVATGYCAYGDMFMAENGISTTSIHVVLGTIGAVGFAASAILASADSSHSALGVGSAIAMGGALIVVPW